MGSTEADGPQARAERLARCQAVLDRTFGRADSGLAEPPAGCDWRRQPALPMPLILHLLQGRQPAPEDIAAFDDLDRWCDGRDLVQDEQQLRLKVNAAKAELRCALREPFKPLGECPECGAAVAPGDNCEECMKDKVGRPGRLVQGQPVKGYEGAIDLSGLGPDSRAAKVLEQRIMKAAVRNRVFEPARWTAEKVVGIGFPWFRLPDVVDWARAEGDIPIPDFVAEAVLVSSPGKDAPDAPAASRQDIPGDPPRAERRPPSGLDGDAAIDADNRARDAVDDAVLDEQWEREHPDG